MSESKSQYLDALRRRRQGITSALGAEATFDTLKPEFYADARVFSEDALKTFEGFEATHPPYGLVDYKGNPITHLRHEYRNPWVVLNYALKSTAHVALEKTKPPIDHCPYHEVLSAKLGGTYPQLNPYDNNERGLDAFRAVITPGGELNSPLFVSLVRRMPALQTLHGSTSSNEEFARRSVAILREPLTHPQQWAKAFVYSLGRLTTILTERFLDDELALQYTKIEETPEGDRLNWAIPTADFTIKQDVDVVSRVLGSELDRTGEHITIYPVGTRLGDIEVDEPTFGCPGNLLAVAMWQRTIDVVVGERLWQTAV